MRYIQFQRLELCKVHYILISKGWNHVMYALPYQTVGEMKSIRSSNQIQKWRQKCNIGVIFGFEKWRQKM